MRISRVLPWPRSPSSTTSWPASSARSSAGSTVSSKPTMPWKRGSPAAQRLEQVLADLGLDGAVSWPEARSSPRVVGGWGVSGTSPTVRPVRPLPRASATAQDGGWQVAAAAWCRCGDGLAVDADLVRGRRGGDAAALAPLDGAAPDLAVRLRLRRRAGRGRRRPASGPASCPAPRRPSAAARRGVHRRRPRRRADVRRQRVGGAAAGRAGCGRSTSRCCAAVGVDRGRRDARAARRRRGRHAAGGPVLVPGRRVRGAGADALPGLPLVGGIAAGLRGAGSTRLLVDGRAARPRCRRGRARRPGRRTARGQPGLPAGRARP